MYRADSKKAEEFISHDEILDTLKYAEENAGNRELISSIIEKQELAKVSVTVKPHFCLNVMTRNCWKRYSVWQRKSSRNSTATE